MKKGINSLLKTPILFPILLTIITSFLFLGSKSFWIDESFSYYTSHSLTILISTIWHEEPNMWIYYFALHFWLLISRGEFFIRSLSAIFAVLSIPIFYKIGELLFNKKVALITCILLSIHVFFILYAQEARSYSLMLLLTCISTYTFLKFKENSKYKILFAVSSMLAVYAHFYAAFVLLAQEIYSVLKRVLKSYIYVFLLIGILLIPLFIAPSLRNGQIVDWIPSTRISEIIGTFFLLGGDFLPLAALYNLLFALGFFIAVKERKHLFPFIWVFIPIIAALLISVVKPIYQSAYLFICLPAFLLITGFALTKIKNIILFYGAFLLLVLFSIIRLYFWYSNTPPIYFNGIAFSYINNIHENWRDAVNYVSTHGERNDIVIFYGYYGKLDYEFYETTSSPRTVEIASRAYDLGGGTLLPEPNKALIKKFTNKYVWFVENRTTGENFNRAKEYNEIKTLLLENYNLVGTARFYKVAVSKYVHK